jgi:predicted MFS family arabinose efflux permease
MAPDPELVWVKLLSFTACLSNVAWGRYQGVYLNQSQGLTSNGALRAMGLAAKFLATPLWGAGADYMGDPVLPLLLSVVLITLLFDFYRWPSVVGAFGPLLVLKVVRSACNGVNTLVDIVTLRTIEFKEAAGYGSQRLWTGIAWGLGSMFVGRFIDRFGYTAIFYWTYLFSALVVVLLIFRPASLRKGPASLGAALPMNGKADGAGGGKRQSLTQLLRAYGAMSAGRPAIRRFLLVMMIYGVAMSLVESVLFLQMERDFGR